LSALGLVGLTFMLAAAVMYFRLPPAEFFEKAFAGARAWFLRGRPDDTPDPYVDGPPPLGVRLDQVDKTCDGFTLYTTNKGSWAKLIDMRGQVVHRWELPFRKAFPRPAHILFAPFADNFVHWFRCHLYPNGDLLAVYHVDFDTPNGYGLAKLDKDSHLLWAYAAAAHHDVDVGEDGTIYALTEKIDQQPPPGLGALPGPLTADSLVLLSPEGRELQTIPLLEAFRDSPYRRLLLAALDLSPTKSAPSPNVVGGDVLHANSVRVLPRSLAARYPMFKPGQVLVSLRTPNALAVVDTRTRRVVWAAQGVWRRQHDAHFLANGHILLYDNQGSSHGARVIEYDPRTQALAWVYANHNAPPLRGSKRGGQQRLPNGNTLIVSPEYWLFFEVTPRGEVVWQCGCEGKVTGARRYRADRLTFLKAGAGPRP
jgi:hypothetical protein